MVTVTQVTAFQSRDRQWVLMVLEGIVAVKGQVFFCEGLISAAMAS